MTDDVITREGLRAELLTLELRLIERLASADRVAALEVRILSPEAVRAIIAKALQDSQARGWTGRERAMGVVLFLMTVCTFALNIYALTRAGVS